MRTITQEINLYELQELPETLQQEIIEKVSYDLEFFYEWACENFVNIYKDIFEISDIEFDLFGQGSGACFKIDFKLSYVEKLLKLTSIRTSLIPLFMDYVSIQYYRINFHYSHENTYQIAVTNEYYYHEKIGDYLNNIAVELQHILNEIKVKLSRILYKLLLADYECQFSDESIRESLVDVMFTRNGGIYHD